MRRLLLISLLCCLFFQQATFSQSFDSLAECHSVNDTLRYLQTIFVTNRDNFVGKPAKEVFRSFQRLLPVKYAITTETSPWIDPKGKAYLEGVSIHYKENDEFFKGFWNGEPQIRFDVYFEDTQIEICDFDNSLPEEDAYDERLFPYLENFIVKDIKVYLSQRKKK